MDVASDIWDLTVTCNNQKNEYMQGVRQELGDLAISGLKTSVEVASSIGEFLMDTGKEGFKLGTDGMTAAIGCMDSLKRTKDTLVKDFNILQTEVSSHVKVLQEEVSDNLETYASKTHGNIKQAKENVTDYFNTAWKDTGNYLERRWDDYQEIRSVTRELATTTFKGMPLNEKIHLALDIGGFVCDPLDIVNAGIYLLEGRLGEAALSGAAIIPLAGIAGTGSKLLDKTIRWGDNAVAVVKAADKVEDGFSTVQSAYNYMLKSGRSRNVLQGVTAVSDNMANGVAKYGDEFLEQVVKKGTKETKETAEELAETARKLNRAGLDEAIEGGTPALAQYGDDFWKMGTYVENPNVKVDWTQYAEHAAERMQQRGMTQEMVNNIVENGKVLSQNNGNKFAYITQEGVAIVSKDGKLITAWSSADFDSSMLEIISKLFGE